MMLVPFLVSLLVCAPFHTVALALPQRKLCRNSEIELSLGMPAGRVLYNGSIIITSPFATEIRSVIDVYIYCMNSDAAKRLHFDGQKVRLVSTSALQDAGTDSKHSTIHQSQFFDTNQSTTAKSSARLLTGALHAGHHTQEYWLSQNVSAQGIVPRTVEDILRASSELVGLSSIYNQTGIHSVHYWHDEPASGYYCSWTRRANDTNPPYPDCPNITQTFTRQSKQLLNAGIDFIATDSTNLGNIGPEADLIQIRPEENLMRAWAQLRKAGTPTPSIAAWQVIAPDMNLWQLQLELYNDPNIAPVILRSPTDPAKKVFFVPWKPGSAPPHGPPDNQTVELIRSNGGRNDIEVVFMWANFGALPYSQGRWSFFAGCMANTTSSVPLKYTTSVASFDLQGCDRPMTTGSPLGSQMSVSPSYMLQRGSLPLAASGKLAGYTMKTMFAGVFRRRPENLFLSDWNAFAQQGQPNPFPNRTVPSQGLGMDGSNDMERNQLFVDTYGTSTSRDIAPSRGAGSLYFDIAASCIRVGRLQAAGIDVTTPMDGEELHAACTVQGEQCCEFDQTVESWLTVWSIRRSDGKDWLLTSSPSEREALINGSTQQDEHAGWKEVCNAFTGPTATCINETYAAKGLPQRLSGPFLTFNWTAREAAMQRQGGPMRDYPEYDLFDGSRPLYRCVQSTGGQGGDGLHFFSLDSKCEGQGRMETIIGGVFQSRSSLAPRQLRRCTRFQGSAGASAPELFYHILDWTTCSGIGDQLGPPLGYVR